MTRSLATSPALVLAREFIQRSVSGVLILRREDTERRLFFQDGRIVYAISNLKADEPAKCFMAAGLLPSAAAPVAAGSGMAALVDAIAKSGLAERPRLLAVARQRLRAIVLDVLSWCEGEAEFREGEAPPTGEILLEEPTPALMLEAARAVPRSLQERLVASLGALLADPSATSAGLPLEPAEWTVLRLLARPMRFDDLRAKVGRAAASDLHRLLAGLIAAGLVSGPGAAPPDTRTREDEPNSVPSPPAPRFDPELGARLEQFEAGGDRDYYELLGVTRGSDIALIRTAFYGLAKRFHPDTARNLSDELRDRQERYFAAVTEAYTVLTHPAERAEYDAQHASRTRTDNPAADPKTLARQNYEAGRRQQSAGKLHDASQFFSNAVRLDAQRAEYHRELGIVQMQNPRGRQTAEEALRRALSLSPGDTRALVHLGLLYKRTGRPDLAEGAFREALRWNPTEEMALAELGALKSARPEGGSRLRGIFGRR